LLVFGLVCCSFNRGSSLSSEESARKYTEGAITLSDFSMKITAHYRSQHLSVPSDFDTHQFFTLLEKIYPDQGRVRFIRDNYRVFVRNLDGGYSAMLCDQETNRKIMEDLSCHLNRVEIRSWEKPTYGKCVFEKNWKPFCE
jgi:hypothetical protein